MQKKNIVIVLSSIIASLIVGMAIQARFVPLPSADEERDFVRGRINASIWILEGMKPFDADLISFWMIKHGLKPEEVHRTRKDLLELGIEVQ